MRPPPQRGQRLGDCDSDFSPSDDGDLEGAESPEGPQREEEEEEEEERKRKEEAAEELAAKLARKAARKKGKGEAKKAAARRRSEKKGEEQEQETAASASASKGRKASKGKKFGEKADGNPFLASRAVTHAFELHAQWDVAASKGQNGTSQRWPSLRDAVEVAIRAGSKDEVCAGHELVLASLRSKTKMAEDVFHHDCLDKGRNEHVSGEHKPVHGHDGITPHATRQIDHVVKLMNLDSRDGGRLLDEVSVHVDQVDQAAADSELSRSAKKTKEKGKSAMRECLLDAADKSFEKKGKGGPKDGGGGGSGLVRGGCKEGRVLGKEKGNEKSKKSKSKKSEKGDGTDGDADAEGEGAIQLSRVDLSGAPPATPSPGKDQGKKKKKTTTKKEKERSKTVKSSASACLPGSAFDDEWGSGQESEGGGGGGSSGGRGRTSFAFDDDPMQAAIAETIQMKVDEKKEAAEGRGRERKREAVAAAEASNPKRPATAAATATLQGTTEETSKLADLKPHIPAPRTRSRKR